MDRSFRLGAVIALTVATLALLVATGVTALLVNTIRLRHSAQAATRSEAYLASVVNVERIVVDAETGLRGYVITGRPLFLAPTHQAEASIAPATATLVRDAAADGAFVARARALGEAARSYLTGYIPQTQRLAATHRRAAQSFASTLGGKTRVDAIRSQTAALERLVSARQSARQRAARHSAAVATTEAIVVLVLLTVFTLLVGAFLGRLVISRDRARRHSEATTQTLRRSLLPSKIPSIPDCEVAVRFLPAGEGELVGGDFYDVFAVGEWQWAIVLGDVCGKGSEAAALTAMARWTLRSLASSAVAPEEALRFLNRSMLSLDLDGRFITIVYALLTVDSDGADISLAAAGHPPPILVPASGEPAALPVQGTLLGVWPDVELAPAQVRLGPGDSLVLYTDGVSDPGPGPQRPPIQTLRDHREGATAEDLAGALEASAIDLAAHQRDDVAILALRLRPQAPKPTRWPSLSTST